MDNELTIGMAQVAPIWLNKSETLEKVAQYITQAGEQGCQLVVFGEALVPGYPFWLDLTHSSSFESQMQKEMHAHYLNNALQMESGDLDHICQLAGKHKTAVYLGTIERAPDRGGHSLYCSLVYIDQKGMIQSVHRKLQPTYEERLSWSPGDGHGLRVHSIGAFTVGGLNCWENWMPLARTALYGLGENLHIAVWPGAERNTKDITRFIAKESRSFVVSVSGLMRRGDIPEDMPHRDEILRSAPETMSNGGSCIAGPDGEWIIAPVVDEEKLIVGTIHYQAVLEERQNFDPVGHYSRPDVTRLTVNRERQSVVSYEE